MNPERFLNLYERIADTPDAVARLRQFVLSLAVRGKLREQQEIGAPEEEIPRVGSAESKVPFDIPKGWRWARLRNLGRLIGGGTPSKSTEAYWNGDIPWVSPKDMKIDHIADSQLKITESAIAVSSAKLIEVGSIIFVVRGMILAHSFPVAITRVPLVINQDMKAITLDGAAMAEYVLRALKGLKLEMLAKVKRSTHGTCRLEDSDYGDFVIPIPPLPEQRRIVAKVDELMALCQQLETAREEREVTRSRFTAGCLGRLSEPYPDAATFAGDARFAIANVAVLTHRIDQVKQVRQAILNLAVRGKLVAQSEGDESVSVLLEAIIANRSRTERRAVSNSSANRIVVLKEDEAPFSIPTSWAWVRFGDLVTCRDGERVPVSKEERSSRAKKYDYYGASGVIDKIDGYLFETPLLLIGEDGANLINRTTPIAYMAHGRYWVNNHAHVLDGLSERYLRYLALFINAIDLRPYVTGTAQPKMNQAKMNRIPVALPPLPEQQRIVERVDKLMAICDRLEAEIARGNVLGGRLLDATILRALDSAQELEILERERVAAYG